MSIYPDKKKPFSLKETMRNQILKLRGGANKPESKIPDDGIEALSGTKPVNFNSDK